MPPRETPPSSQPHAWSPEHCSVFVDAEYGRLFSWLARLCGDRELAADLTQETFTAFWTSLARQQVQHPVRWLFRIGRNRWRKMLRSRQRELNALGKLRPNDGPPSQAASTPTATLVELVRNLPPPYCDAVTLRYWCDFSYADIGVIQRVPAALARWRVHRARTLLHQRITSDQKLLEDLDDGYVTTRT